MNEIKRRADQHALALLAAGLLGVAWHNWRLWQRDQAQIDRIRSERTPTPTLDRTPKISALVAAWNEAERIDDHLRSFLALHYPNIELILCAGGSDATLDRAKQYASERVIVVEQSAGQGKQRALACGYEYATGDLIYLTDADCVFNDVALLRLLDPIVNDGEHVATGISRPLDDQINRLLPRWVWSADVVASARQGRYSGGLLGRNALVTRQALDQIGGLDFVARTGTDYHLARRLLAAGVQIRFVPTSVVASAYPDRIRSYWQRQSRWMRNLLLYGGRYRAYHQVWDTVRSALIGLLMLALPVASLRLGRVVAIGWLLLLTQAAIAKVRYMAFTARVTQQPLLLLHTFAVLPLTLIEFAIWVSPVLQVMSKRQRERW